MFRAPQKHLHNTAMHVTFSMLLPKGIPNTACCSRLSHCEVRADYHSTQFAAEQPVQPCSQLLLLAQLLHPAHCRHAARPTPSCQPGCQLSNCQFYLHCALYDVLPANDWVQQPPAGFLCEVPTITHQGWQLAATVLGVPVMCEVE